MTDYFEVGDIVAVSKDHPTLGNRTGLVTRNMWSQVLVEFGDPDRPKAPIRRERLPLSQVTRLEQRGCSYCIGLN